MLTMRSSGLIRRSDDAGVTAVIVALVSTTILAGFGAMAIDFGSAFARQSSLQRVADLAAEAGATRLPSIDSARTAAIDNLCAPENSVLGWPSTMCSDRSWASDGDQSNGEIVFYGHDDNRDGLYEASEEVSTGDATALRVLPPPSTVSFSLARLLGIDSVSVRRAATARMGTAVGYGVLPGYLPRSLTGGSFCWAQVPVPPPPPPQPPLVPPPPFTPVPNALSIRRPVPSTNVVPGVTALRIRVNSPLPLPSTNLIEMRINGVVALPLLQPTTRTVQAVVPASLSAFPPGTQVWVWLDFIGPSPSARISNAYQVTLGGTVPSTPPCPSQLSNTGYVDEPRFLFTATTVEANIKHGMDHTVAGWQSYPNAPGNGAPLPATDCSGQPGIAKVSGATPLPIVNCVPVRPGDTGTQLADGLVDSNGSDPGRLLHDSCPGGGGSIPSGPASGVDGNSLFQQDFIDASSGVTKDQFKAAIQSGQPPKYTLVHSLNSKIFSCPRFGIMPVLDVPLTAGGAANLPVGGDSYPVTGFKYVYLDDEGQDRGLVWQAGSLTAVRGWIIDPAFLPDLVDGSPAVSDYAGSGLSREVVLVKDIGDPPT
jgi:Putative Flp pilus-assembly TadE/G-like